MFSDVIIPLDGSSNAARAIGPAIKIAKASGSKVHVVAYSETSDNFGIEAMVRLQAELLKVAHVEHDLKVEVATDPIPDLLARSAAASQSFICMATHGRGRSETFFGSVASETLRTVRGPVLLIGPNCDDTAFDLRAPMIVPIDGSATSETFLPIATAWSNVFDPPMHVVSLIDPSEVPASTPSNASTLLESNYVRYAAIAAQKELDRPVHYEVLHGHDPVEAIIQYANGRGAGLIGMATHGQTGLARLFAGSITSQVVHDATCPVLVLRPPELAMT